MLQASIELNKAIHSFIEVCHSLGEAGGLKACEIDDESRIRAAIKLLKAYELCVRADETLGDLLRHNATNEAEEGILGRTTEIITELTQVFKSFKDKEKSIVLSNLNKDFIKHKDALAEILNQRPGARIWDSSGISTVVANLSKAIEELRKSCAYSLLKVSNPEDSEKYLGKLMC